MATLRLTVAASMGSAARLALVLAPIACTPEPSRAVHLWETPAWRSPGQLRLRSHGSALLLHKSESEHLYVFDAGTAQLSEADLGVWDSASGSTVECSSAGRPDPNIWRIDPSGGLLFRGHTLTAKGTRTLLLRLSPTGRWMATLTAKGEASLLPFLGSGPTTEPYVHELRPADGRKRPLAARELPAACARGSLDACWTADERYVVYYDFNFSYLCIVSVETATSEE